MRHADVLRRVLGVPHQLLRQRVLGIEVQIAEQAFAGAKLYAANDAQPILIIARRKRVALRVIDVDLGAFVQTDGLDERVFAIAAAVREARPSSLTPRMMPASRSTRSRWLPESTNSCSGSDMVFSLSQITKKPTERHDAFRVGSTRYPPWRARYDTVISC